VVSTAHDSPVDWKPRIVWGALAVLVGLGAWQLTRWITYVNRDARATITIAFDERPPLQLDRALLNAGAFQQDRFRVPRVVIISYAEALFLVTPASFSVRIDGVNPKNVSCGFSDRIATSASAAYLSETIRQAPLTPIEIPQSSASQTLILVPSALHAALAHERGQGIIACRVARPLPAAPTFTDRSITVHALDGPTGAVFFDVSALEDIDNLRFSGGLQVPFAGERTRLLDSSDSIVTAEWANVTAQEQRDIVLVLVGALAAIAAAMAIEAIRPLVEPED
jgi:hypothetical protein